MRSISFDVVIFPVVLYIVFFVLWKFYQMFGKINENIAGIKRALEKSTLLQ